jgi:ribosomal protein S11
VQLPRRALGTEDPQSHGLLRISSRFAGDLLFIIDRRPYEIAVEQAKADVERAKAKLEIASLDVQPATPLVRSQSLTEREFDTRKAAERDAAGQVGSTEAAYKFPTRPQYVARSTSRIADITPLPCNRPRQSRIGAQFNSI